MTQTLHTEDGNDPASQSRRVFIATPCYERPSGIYQASLIRTLSRLERIGTGWEHCLLLGNCHVDDARNTLVRNFRASKCTDLFFIDADNGWASEDFVRMLSIGEEFVCGIYPLKNMDQSEWPVGVMDGVELRGKPDPWSHEGIVEILRGPTGMMRLRRSVIDKMVERYGDRRYKGGDQRDDLPLSVILFERTYESDPTGGAPEIRRWGGDWAFCNKWRALGGTIWCDPQMKFQHVGPWTFEGSIGEHWRDVHGVKNDIRKARLSELMAQVMADPVAASTDVPLLVDLLDVWNNPWALPPDQLSIIMSLALQSEGPTLECGSGLSTLLLAAVAAKTGRKHYALESNRWHSATNLMHLRRYGLQRHVELIPADLAVKDGGEWYDITGELPRNFGLLVIDGPPQELNVAIRWQAMERLRPFLAPGASIIADDVDQKGLEQHIPDWERLIGGKVHIFDGNPRKFAIARIPKAAEASLSGAA